ncbi:MAG: hypothetical protein M0Z33_10225 [Actinomycetota bacterium]|nr:hypothetical protein [Actinomycetota bacterium]
MSGWVTAVVVALLAILAVVSLLVRRHGESPRPERGWTRTSEVFKDPGSDRTMRVWVDESGGRHYVPEEGAPR